MKELALPTAAVSLTLIAPGQSASSSSVDGYECIYGYQVKSTKGSTDVTSIIPQIGRNTAEFSDYTTFQVDFAIACKIPETDIQKFKAQETRNNIFFDQSVSQNEPKGELTVYSVITPNYYSHTENTTLINRNLSEETNTVCGYICQEAMGGYGGRVWTVWYSSEISVFFGPWKLCGLPGLVLAANDAENIHQLKAITSRKSNTPMNLKPHTNPINISGEQPIEAKNKFETGPMGNISGETTSEMSVRKFDNGEYKALINDVVVRVHPNGYVSFELE